MNGSNGGNQVKYGLLEISYLYKSDSSVPNLRALDFLKEVCDLQNTRLALVFRYSRHTSVLPHAFL